MYSQAAAMGCVKLRISRIFTEPLILEIFASNNFSSAGSKEQFLFYVKFQFVTKLSELFWSKGYLNHCSENCAGPYAFFMKICNHENY